MKCIQDNPNLLSVLVDHLLKTKIEYKDSKKEEIHDIFYQSKLDKACFQHGMAYKDFQYLLAEQFLIKYCDKAFNIAKNAKHDEYQKDLTFNGL